MTQKDVCDATGWSKGYVSRLLSGEGNVTLRTLARFEDAVGGDVLLVPAPPPRLGRQYVVRPVQNFDRALLPTESVRLGSTLLQPGNYIPANDYSPSLTTDV